MRYARVCAPAHILIIINMAALCWTFIGSAVLCYTYAAYVILCAIALRPYIFACATQQMKIDLNGQK